MSDNIRDEQFLADIRSAARGEATYYNLDPIIRKEYYYTDIITALKSGGGGGGFTPTQDQLDAMNSGINAERVQELEGIDETGDNYIEINGVKLYFGSTTPSNPSDGDWWLD